MQDLCYLTVQHFVTTKQLQLYKGIITTATCTICITQKKILATLSTVEFFKKHNFCFKGNVFPLKSEILPKNVKSQIPFYKYLFR